MVAGLVEYLVISNEYDYKDITVLTPYNGQLAVFTERLKKICSLWLSDKDREALIADGLLDHEDMQAGRQTKVDLRDMLRLATIDNFQGEESKVVILSTVRSNDADQVGFMKTPNRINVACSRARNCFYVVGNATLMGTVPMWRQIINLLASKRKIGPGFRVCCTRHPQDVYLVRKPHQWYAIPECNTMCNFKFDCGHHCGISCHAPSLHERVGCTEPCERFHGECGHSCQRLCGQPCGECTNDEISTTLDCGHRANLTCAQVRNGKSRKDLKCNIIICTEVLKCGHEQGIICSEQDNTPGCSERCDQPLHCGHKCQGICYACTLKGHHAPCKAICQKRQPNCDHNCVSKCHPETACPPCQMPCPRSCRHKSCAQVCSEACDPCLKICEWECPHEGSCTTLCCLPCNRVPCNEACTQTLPCGHICPSLCGELCPRVCLQCITGTSPEKAQMFLSCGHNFDLETLDQHVGIESLYCIEEDGRIERVLEPFSDRPRDFNTQCPMCGQGCANIKRYALHAQLQRLEDIIDSLYVRIHRKTWKYMDQIRGAKGDLDTTFDGFQKKIRPGPLTGRANEFQIRERGNAMVEIQGHIEGFRGTKSTTETLLPFLILCIDDIVKPFESAMTSLALFLNGSNNFCGPNAALKLRLDTLYQRCRLIVLEESVRIVKTLEAMTEQSQHTTVLVEGLRHLTITQARHQLWQLASIVAECEMKHLKRLECEARLIQACFHLVLRELGEANATSKADENLHKAQRLCDTYPETAGLLLPTYENIRRSFSPDRRKVKTFYAREFKDIWWYWPRHKEGALKQCLNGHTYSGLTWSECPECGREVEKPESLPPTPLQDQAFVVAMKTVPASFDGSSYRRQPS